MAEAICKDCGATYTLNGHKNLPRFACICGSKEFKLKN
jgi:ribosomal protein S27AE